MNANKKLTEDRKKGMARLRQLVKEVGKGEPFSSKRVQEAYNAIYQVRWVDRTMGLTK